METQKENILYIFYVLYNIYNLYLYAFYIENLCIYIMSYMHILYSCIIISFLDIQLSYISIR